MATLKCFVYKTGEEAFEGGLALCLKTEWYLIPSDVYAEGIQGY